MARKLECPNNVGWNNYSLPVNPRNNKHSPSNRHQTLNERSPSSLPPVTLLPPDHTPPHTPPPLSPPPNLPPSPPPPGPPEQLRQWHDVERVATADEDEYVPARPEETGDEELDRLVDMYWASMQTRTRRGAVMETLNVRLWDGAADGANATLRNPQAWERLLEIWGRQESRVKINCSVGCVLENKTDGQLRYFHASANNATVFPTPRLVSSRAGLEEFFDELLNVDLQEQAIRRRPSTQWKLRFLTNISFYLFKLKNMARIGGGGDGNEKVPEFLKRNRSVVTLDGYDDNLCFFRCLYLHANPEAGIRPPKREVDDLLATFLRHSSAPTDVEEGGVNVDDLVTAEKCFDVPIVVLCMRDDGTSTVVRASTSKPGATLYLNLHRNHFSYIKNIEAYAKAYVCPKCDACFDRFSNCKRHSCNPEKTSKYVFKGGVFEPPPTIFSKLAKVGIVVGDDQARRYYEYVITYDIECMLPSTDAPAPSHSTSYNNTHEFLSVSVCSNVPGFRRPVCFVRESSASECVGRFVDYLDRVSRVAGDLVRRRFVDVFDKLRAMVKRRQRRESRECRRRRRRNRKNTAW